MSDLNCSDPDTCKKSILGQREQLRAKILSTINGIECDRIKYELTSLNNISSSPFFIAKPNSVWRSRQCQTLVNLAHSQSLKPELVAQLVYVLGSQALRPMENLLPLERQVGASSSDDRLMPMRVSGDPKPS